MMWVAMAAGLQDGRSGLPIDKNPYAPGTEAASVWEAGWHIATGTTDLQRAQAQRGASSEIAEAPPGQGPHPSGHPVEEE